MEIKKKKCKVCETEFTPYKTTDRVCSGQCASEEKKGREATKKQRKTERQRQERVYLLDLAKKAFNAYIRKRDEKELCICCDKPLGDNYHAGHYFSGGGHAAVMFDEDNVHAQRFECNIVLAGNNQEYSTRIESRIGVHEFEALRAKAYEEKTWTVDELKGIINEYKRKLKELC